MMMLVLSLIEANGVMEKWGYKQGMIYSSDAW